MTLDLTPREIRLLLDAAAHYDAQVRPPGVAHLRSAGRKLLLRLDPRQAHDAPLPP